MRLPAPHRGRKPLRWRDDSDRFEFAVYWVLSS